MRRRLTFGAFVVAGLAAAAALVVVVAPLASSEPDGLERVAVDNGFAEQEEDHALSDAPTAGYAVDGVDDDRLGAGLAGLVGVAATFALTGGVFLLVRRSGRRGGGAAGDGAPPAPG